MAIQVKASLRKNPQDKKAAGKYYAQVVLAPEMNTETNHRPDRWPLHRNWLGRESSAGRIDDGYQT